MLWITQINAAAREQGMAYSQFANALRAAEIDLNRKVLSEMAITEPLSFRAVLEVSKAAKAAASASKAAGAPKAPA
jgi:large subunit ribosomal protein L20